MCFLLSRHGMDPVVVMTGGFLSCPYKVYRPRYLSLPTRYLLSQKMSTSSLHPQPFLIKFNDSDEVRIPGPILNPPKKGAEGMIPIIEPLPPTQGPLYVTANGENQPLILKSIPNATKPEDIPKESLWYIADHEAGGSYIQTSSDTSALRVGADGDTLVVTLSQPGTVWFIRLSGGDVTSPDGFSAYVTKPKASKENEATPADSDYLSWTLDKNHIKLSELTVLPGKELVFVPVTFA